MARQNLEQVWGKKRKRRIKEYQDKRKLEIMKRTIKIRIQAFSLIVELYLTILSCKIICHKTSTSELGSCNEYCYVIEKTNNK